MHEAVVDGRRLRMQTHDLVALQLVAGDAMAVIDDQLLDSRWLGDHLRSGWDSFRGFEPLRGLTGGVD